jgi:hypothetical protein
MFARIVRATNRAKIRTLPPNLPATPDEAAARCSLGVQGDAKAHGEQVGESRKGIQVEHVTRAWSSENGNSYHSRRGGVVDRFADVDSATIRRLDVNEQRLSAEFGRPADG